MTKKIFNAIFIVAFTVLLASLTISTFVLFSYFSSIQQTQLRDELNLAVKATETLGISYLERIKDTNNRLTLIDTDGTVLFDSRADAKSMENHKDRIEVKTALHIGSGSSTRYSSTLTQQTIYVAKQLSNGNILRISSARASVWVLIMGMLQPLSIVIVFALMVSAFLAMHMAKLLVEPLNSLNLEKPLENEIYEEISPLLRRIHLQQDKIQNQIRELTHKKKEFEQITSNMKEALVLLDPSNRVIAINPAAMRLFGVDFDCVGMDFLTIDRTLNLSHAIENAKLKNHYRFRANRNENEYQFDISRIDSHNDNGISDFQGIVLLAFDITEQIHAEQHRREFTANVSHELKTPLQSIIGSVELLENNIVKPKDIPHFIGLIKKEASRLVFLIDDILRLSRLDENAKMPFERLSLLELAREVKESLSNVAKMSDISLEVKGDAGMTIGVRELLIRTIYNLCDNAIKYNKKQGSVKIIVAKQKDFVKLTVEDSGIGISPEHHEKIFERFYRVDKSHSKQTGGTGLGLSIVKHAVQIHKGYITVDSKLGEGCAVSIFLPLL